MIRWQQPWGRTNVSYQLSVDDPATYASAWSDFANDNLQEGSVSYLSSVLAYGAHPGTHVVANIYQLSWRSIIEPATDQWRDLMCFLQRVSGIRTVEGRVVTTVVAEWRP